MNNTNSPLTYLPLSRRTIGAVGLTAALLLGVPASALAGGTPSTVTVPFSSTGSEQSFTVPVGVSSLRVQAIGQAGGTGESIGEDEEGPTPGGSGAYVSGQLPVVAGEVLYVEVAGSGFNGTAGGGDEAGSGGGASDVRTVSTESPETLESRLLVAGGGGGGGSAIEGTGGRGGDAGSAGGNGVSVERFEEEGGIAIGIGGGAGTLTGGGEASLSCGGGGEAGTLGVGGVGGNGFGPFSGGGGGGGGYYGGAGGTGSCDEFERGEEGTGGGGGGGSSFVSEAATFASFGLASSSTAPSVSITYATPATATPDKDAITFAATQPLETVSPPQTLTITNEGGNPLVINSETFTDSDPGVSTDKPEDFLISSSSCLGPIGYEESCTLTVRFTPEEEGPQTASLKISSNAGAGATSVTLTGTGGTLPQGPVGATGAEGKEGKEGKEGPTGATGSQGATGTTGATGAQGTTGATGATGPQGSTGEAGPKGETGATGPQGTAGEAGKLGIAGAIGPKGPKGDKGAKGDRGAQGPQGLTALYVCHKRELSGKYKKACFVQVLSASSSAVKATLSRNGVIYARGKGGGTSSQTLELGASKPVPNGHYELTLISKSLASTTQTITVG